MDFKQLRTSNAIKFFEKGFADKWKLKEYTDITAPAVFFGVYNDEDVRAVEMHLGEKILVFAGADIINYERFKHLNCISDQYIFKKNLIIPVKSFDKFKPTTLGDKIYVYMSTNDDNFKNKFRFDIVRELMNHFGTDNFIVGYHGHSIDEIITNYYSKAFVNLQLNKDAGFTTALEMAHMGRRSISNYPAPFCLGYKSVEDIIELIENEKQFINTNVTIDISKYLFDSTDWLRLDFWK